MQPDCVNILAAHIQVKNATPAAGYLSLCLLVTLAIMCEPDRQSLWQASQRPPLPKMKGKLQLAKCLVLTVFAGLVAGALPLVTPRHFLTASQSPHLLVESAATAK